MPGHRARVLFYAGHQCEHIGQDFFLSCTFRQTETTRSSFLLLSHNHQIQWNTANMQQTAFKIQAETCMSYLPFPQGIHYFCMLYCIVFLRRDWEVMSKTRASCFIRGSKHLETIKALGLRSRALICFSVFRTPDETSISENTKRWFFFLFAWCLEKPSRNYCI